MFPRLSCLTAAVCVFSPLFLFGCDSNVDAPQVEIEDIEVGDGTAAERGMVVTVHYTGWFTDQTIFDTTEGGEPVTLWLEYGEVIDGWVQGLSGMREGGIRRLQIPPELAYGKDGIVCEGYGESGVKCEDPDQEYAVPPNATLIFRVELLNVEDPAMMMAR